MRFYGQRQCFFGGRGGGRGEALLLRGRLGFYARVDWYFIGLQLYTSKKQRAFYFILSLS